MFFQTRSEWDAPTFLELLLSSPVKLLLCVIYSFFVHFRSSPSVDSPPISVVCISDTHTQTKDIPPGDLLVHAGDLTNAGNIEELQAAIDWLDSLPHKHKVVIAGNHDTFLDPRSRTTLPQADQKGQLDWKGITYLQHSSATLPFSSHANRKLTVYGAPQIPACGGSEFAFQYLPGQDAWSETVPDDVDILVTHTPPLAHRDINGRHGCNFLLREAWRVKPRLHVFGHVHAMSGSEFVCWDAAQRAFEAGLARQSRGLIRQALDVYLWIQVLSVAYWGLKESLWDLVWGGEQRRTVLVNAALMSQATGEVSNDPQVVQL